MFSDQQFERTRRLALNLAGIELVERHRELLGRRSQRIGILSGETLDSLPDGVLILDPSEHLGNAGHWFSRGLEGVYWRRQASVPLHRTQTSPFAAAKG